MIRSVTKKRGEDTPIDWWDNVPFLNNVDSWEFSPNVNIIFGPNGSGKSSLLTAIARRMFCEQGGRQLVTTESISWHKGDKEGLAVDHDGSSVTYMDPSKDVGLIGGAFDDDFFAEGLKNIFSKKRSEGERVLERLSSIVVALRDNDGSKLPEFEWKTQYLKENNKEIELFLKGTGEKLKPTIILDEPTRNLGVVPAVGFWKLVERSSNFQFIIATHDPFALYVLKKASFLETESQYINTLKTILKAMT